jgi:hypothetical protein
MPKNFLSTATITAGFVLISVGVGKICGLGAGLIIAGALLVVLQWWVVDSK